MLSRSADDLFTITVERPDEAQALAASLQAGRRWLEVVPGIASVTVRFDVAAEDADAVERELRLCLDEGVEPLAAGTTPVVEIPVVYGGEHGPDLETLCERVGLSPDEVVALHTKGEYPVDMLGFTPGFAFIGGLDERLRVPRREAPRQRVPAGSVGIADGRTGLYAIASPGGWTLIGRTPAPLFDPGADEPFLLRAGMRVRFVAVDAAEFET